MIKNKSYERKLYLKIGKSDQFRLWSNYQINEIGIYIYEIK